MIQKHLLRIQKVLKRSLSKMIQGNEAADNTSGEEVEAVPEAILAAETLPYVANT